MILENAIYKGIIGGLGALFCFLLYCLFVYYKFILIDILRKKNDKS